MRGAVHERTGGHAPGAGLQAALGDLLRRLDRRAAATRATHRPEEDVFVAPHDALRHARGAAGVQDVERVGGARREVARGARGRERGFVRDRPDRRAGAGIAREVVVDRDEGLQLGQIRGDGGELGRELGVEDDGARVGVVEEVPQLLLDVAVVDVDRHRAELERGEHAFEVLDAVVEVQGDVVTGADAAVLQHVREPVGPGVRGRERQAPFTADEGLVGGHGVGDALPQVGQVELHPPPERREPGTVTRWTGSLNQMRWESRLQPSAPRAI